MSTFTTVHFSKFVGIDPGLSGAVVVLYGGKLTAYRDFRKREEISRAVVKATDPTDENVWLEQVHAMPGEGVVSVFSFGRSTGTALGAVEAVTGRSPKQVAPQRWQNFFKALLGIDAKTKFKEVTRDVAAQLFPSQKDLFARKKDHGTSDATLIALYGAAVGVPTE